MAWFGCFTDVLPIKTFSKTKYNKPKYSEKLKINAFLAIAVPFRLKIKNKKRKNNEKNNINPEKVCFLPFLFPFFISEILSFVSKYQRAFLKILHYSYIVEYQPLSKYSTHFFCFCRVICTTCCATMVHYQNYSYIAFIFISYLFFPAIITSFSSGNIRYIYTNPVSFATM